MNRGTRIFVLPALALTLGAATCRKNTKAPGDENIAVDDAGAKHTVSPKAIVPARAGLYSCTLTIAEDDEVRGQCSVSESQELSWSAPSFELKAALTPTRYGFSVAGELLLGEASHPITSELFRQGKQSHALVTHLSDGRVARFAMFPPGTHSY